MLSEHPPAPFETADDRIADDHVAAAPLAERHAPLETCHEWLRDAHRRVSSRLFHGHREAHDPAPAAAPERIVFVPRSRPERAHTIELRRIDDLALVAALAREQWFVQETAIDTALGPTGHLEVRLRAEWVIGPPAIQCAALRPRTEPACIVSATADLPLDASAPRLVSCVICYDDARITV